jgi:hypothetical protein
MNRQAVIQAGRGVLVDWLARAEAHGTIYATRAAPVTPRGIGRFNLYTIAPKQRGERVVAEVAASIRGAQKGIRGGFPTATLVKLWPALPDNVEGCDIDVGRESDDYSRAIDLIAKDWGFSFAWRCFAVSGGGMDPLFDLVDGLSERAGVRGEGKKLYAYRVKVELLG